MPARRLSAWFAKAKRPMPWRTHVEPYLCYLSEIMLQQTTFEQALPYYESFLTRFPTVEDLAAADEQAVLKAWAGLGYYARARNLHKAARQIVQNGAWPVTAAAWREVPGVGPYTAAALASVLNGERVPVVDGNVARVFARYWLLSDDFSKLPAREKLAARLKEEFFDAAPRVKPGDLNQAMMELGALVCTPRDPKCAQCPLAKNCTARAKGAVEAYPVKRLRRPVPVRAATVAIVTDGEGRVLLARNTEGGLLKGLWELPLVTSVCNHVQVFSHFKLELTAQRVASGASFQYPAELPLTTATKRVLEKCGILECT